MKTIVVIVSLHTHFLVMENEFFTLLTLSSSKMSRHIVASFLNRINCSACHV